MDSRSMPNRSSRQISGLLFVLDGTTASTNHGIIPRLIKLSRSAVIFGASCGIARSTSSGLPSLATESPVIIVSIWLWVGLGFVLGDGRLTYGPEKIMETYYNFAIPLHSGIFAALDFQYIDDPGYNRAR